MLLLAFIVLSIIWTPPATARHAPPATAEQLATYETSRAWVARQSDLRGAGDEVTFLVEMIKGVKLGRTLDVGMGQGRRHTICLARQGWDSVGFDPGDQAVAAA